MPSIKFAIASHKDFATSTYKKCVSSLINAGVPADDIYFIEGGLQVKHTATSFAQMKVPEQIHYYLIKEDAMDYNAFLGVLNLNLKADYWFMLHDTCWVGEGFYEAVKGLKIDSPVVALCKEGFSMNIGLYSQGYLKAHKWFIEQFTTFPDKATLKKYMVATEDALLASYKKSSYLCKDLPEVTGPTDLYGNGVPRIVVHYKEIDLYKSKANWEPKEQYELGL